MLRLNRLIFPFLISDNPSLSNAELFRRLGLRQSGFAQPFIDAREQLGPHFKLCGFFLGKEVVE